MGLLKQKLADANQDLVEARSELLVRSQEMDATVTKLQRELAEAKASKDAVIIELAAVKDSFVVEFAEIKTMVEKFMKVKQRLAVVTRLCEAGKRTLSKKQAELTNLSMENAAFYKLTSVVYLYWTVVADRDQLQEQFISLKRQVLLLLLFHKYHAIHCPLTHSSPPP
jgi:uncharacterized membrane protein YheB (UPF0754 family)